MMTKRNKLFLILAVVLLLIMIWWHTPVRVFTNDEYEIINKVKHECILKKKGICEFPTEDCSNINGNIIKINDTITTSDVRLIKWLTGYTVDANFYESSYINKKWVKKEKILKL